MAWYLPSLGMWVRGLLAFCVVTYKLAIISQKTARRLWYDQITKACAGYHGALVSWLPWLPWCARSVVTMVTMVTEACARSEWTWLYLQVTVPKWHDKIITRKRASMFIDAEFQLQYRCPIFHKWRSRTTVSQQRIGTVRIFPAKSYSKTCYLVSWTPYDLVVQSWH